MEGCVVIGSTPRAIDAEETACTRGEYEQRARRYVEVTPKAGEGTFMVKEEGPYVDRQRVPEVSKGPITKPSPLELSFSN